jgi:hypothetical protein
LRTSSWYSRAVVGRPFRGRSTWGRAMRCSELY